MARTLLTPVQLAIFDGVAGANEFLAAETAADVSNGNAFDWTGREVVLLHNTDASNARTVTVSSVADRNGRTGDITTYSTAAGEIHILPPFKYEGWRQADGRIYLDGSHASLKFSVIRLPAVLPL